MLTVMAPAKLNLTLEVLGKRPDRFHEIRSVVQTIDLCDSLQFKLSHNIQFICDKLDWIAEHSLIPKAAILLQQTTGCSKGAIVNISKHIPWASGLGGDSSGAAATLLGLNKLWGLGLALPELANLASQLGSDVTLFLHGGTVLLEGRGEMVTPLPPLPHMWALLVVPPVPRPEGKTAKLYAGLIASHYSDGQITDIYIGELRVGREITPSLLFNTFENIAFAQSSKIDLYRKHLEKIGLADVHLAGSGPTLFSLVKDKSHAEELYTRLQQQKLEAYLAETLTDMDLARMSNL